MEPNKTGNNSMQEDPRLLAQSYLMYKIGKKSFSFSVLILFWQLITEMLLLRCSSTYESFNFMTENVAISFKLFVRVPNV